MQKQNRKFLQFNGQNLLFKSVDGTVWIAIKPICGILKVNYDRQFKNLKADQILAPAYAVQPIQVPGDQTRNMVCLPEKFLYGWLLGIRSESPELKAYQWECYQVLYDHFHGPLAERLQVLQVKSQAQLEAEQWEVKLKQTEEYKQLQLAVSRARGSGKLLQKLDKTLTEQLDLFH